MGATISLGQARLAVEPGAEATLDVTIRNTGGVVDQFAIEILGDTAPWAIPEPPTISLFPGAEGVVRVQFKPPRAASTPAGPVRFGVMARSSEDPTGSAVEEGVLDVGAYTAPSAELIPRTSHGSRRARHELAIDNRGNAPIAAAVEGLDADRLLRFSVDPPTVDIPPGVAGFANVDVRPVRAFWRGPAKSRPFQLAVRTAGPDSPPLLVDGNFLQESILPWWFLRALLLLGALLIAAILFWLFILQPAIKSTAADTLEEFGFTPRPTVQGNGNGNGNGSPGPVPSDALLVTPRPAGQASQVDGRLENMGKVSPTGGTLSITDLVFSNATGASGDLVLQRVALDGTTTTLLILRMENFRDIDYHFVTPITIRDGESLQLVGTCVAGGAPVTPACAPSVFYSGILKGNEG